MHRIGEVREVFDLTTADGTRVQLFAADNDAGGQCSTVTRNLSPDTGPRDLGYGCAAGEGYPPPNGLGLVQTDSENRGPPILYDDPFEGFTPPVGAVAVQVRGQGLDRILELDREQRWAVELAASFRGGRFTADYLDSDDALVRKDSGHVGWP